MRVASGDRRAITLALMLGCPLLLLGYVSGFLVFRHHHTGVVRVAKDMNDMGVLADATVVYRRGFWSLAGYRLFYPLGTLEYGITGRPYLLFDYTKD